MKQRPDGFLKPEHLGRDTEIFDYIHELHGYLWRFIAVAYPGIGGSLDDLIDPAIEKLENTQKGVSNGTGR